MERSSLWKDYEIIATGDGLKLERWKDIYLLRPDPQVIWPEILRAIGMKFFDPGDFRSVFG